MPLGASWRATPTAAENLPLAGGCRFTADFKTTAAAVGGGVGKFKGSAATVEVTVAEARACIETC